MFNKSNFDNAVKIKGYGSYERGVSYGEIEKIKIKNKINVKPTIVKNLQDYFKFLNEIETSYTNPIFFRGQTNADYLLIPSGLRLEPKNEHLMIEAFSRKFFDELNKYHSSMEKLVLMQHFLLPTRCFDISESPLMALYFACSHTKKFRTKIIKPEEEDWGEIVLFREPSSEDKKPEKLKSIESSNISIIANTAFMETDFSLWHLGARWKKDVDLGHDEKYIDLRSIVRRSYIVRVPHTNARIKNQQGAFIMVNANMSYVEDNKSEKKKMTEKILQEEYITYVDLMETALGKKLNNEETWHLRFEKIKPYDKENTIEIFRTDPFDLKRLFYKDENDVQQVVLIPPDCKRSILNELAKLNITEDFVYPDMDNVANEISEQINKS